MAGPCNNLLHSQYESLARGLLRSLPDEELTALVKTASNGRILPVDVHEACSAVLLTCPNVAKLFSYRKLTSLVLREYLFSQGVRLNGHVTRTQLVITIIQRWDKLVKKGKKASNSRNTAAQPNRPVIPEPDDYVQVQPLQNVEVKMEPNAKEEEALFDLPTQEELLPSLFPAPPSSSSTTTKQLPPDVSHTRDQQTARIKPPSMSSIVPNRNMLDGGHSLSSWRNESSSSSVCISSSREYNRSNNNDFESGNINNHATVNILSSPQSNTNSTSMSVVMSDEFSHDYCEWFYTMLNRLQPEVRSSGSRNNTGDRLKPEVFCSNSSVEMYLVDGDKTQQCKAEGSQQAYDIIREQLLNLKLMFVPNIGGGVQAKKSPHGIIQLFCCGTLHVGSSFIGIFEQEFGLVSSPIDKTWKIVYTKINLKKMACNAYTPSLPQSEVFAIEC